MVELELTYEQLYKLYGKGEHEVPYKVTDEIYVRTPTGRTKINEVVTKHNNEVISLDFNDGDKFECSVNHIFQDYHTGTEIKAIDAKEITSTYGKKIVVEKTPIGIENVYDISIDAPHWYISSPKSGIYHHNTFFSLAVVKNFLDNNPNGYCLYFDTEAAITKSLLESRGIDTSRLVVVNVVTVEEFRGKALKAVDLYMKKPEGERNPCMFVLDSLGMLSTSKEINDALNDKEVRDMTKSQLIKGAFRMLTLKLGQAKIPMLVTNHTYEIIGCALKGTKVKTPNGDLDISEIKVGDYVNTMVGPKKVINTYEYDAEEYYQIELANGAVYKLTGDHKLMTQEGEWKKVSELTEEDVIINIGN
jgi:intein/homing endonuclease